MIILGLTGSIGMGKSTTTQMFRDLGIPVYDADASVHALYEGDLVPILEKAFPGVSVNGKIDRECLSIKVIGDRNALVHLEKIVHPAVREREEAFLKQHYEAGSDLVVLDIPLLFETGGDKRVDKIAVVSAPPAIQRERVLKRPDMDVDKFEKILARQMSDAEKRAPADFIIDTSKGLDEARAQVMKVVGAIRSE